MWNFWSPFYSELGYKLSHAVTRWRETIQSEIWKIICGHTLNRNCSDVKRWTVFTYGSIWKSWVSWNKVMQIALQFKDQYFMFLVTVGRSLITFMLHWQKSVNCHQFNNLMKVSLIHPAIQISHVNITKPWLLNN